MVKLGLEEWRHWLGGAEHKFIVWTDHKNFKYIRSAKRLNPCQARWMLFFERFNFTLTTCPGFRNIKPDALSHQFSPDECVEEPETILLHNRVVASLTWKVESLVHPAQSLIQEMDLPTPPRAQVRPVPSSSVGTLVSHPLPPPSYRHPGGGEGEILVALTGLRHVGVCKSLLRVHP